MDTSLVLGSIGGGVSLMTMIVAAYVSKRLPPRQSMDDLVERVAVLEARRARYECKLRVMKASMSCA